MKKWFFPFLFLLFSFASLLTAETNDWYMVWNDEFENQSLDLKKWNIVEGGFGGGNDELQYYSSRPENVFVSNGNLVLQALREQFRGKSFTSGNVSTQDKAEWLNGRFEFRAKLPESKGMWPAIWMMPTGFIPFWDKTQVSKNRYGEWPSCGEIDIMELGGSKAQTVQGTLNFGKPYMWVKRTYTLKDNRKFSDDFHVFAFEWEPGVMRWYVDGELYATQNRWYGRARPTTTNFVYPAPFDVKFFLKMNLSVGGNFDGDPDGSTKFPGQMLVDYVRVYQKTKYPPIDLEVTNSIPQDADFSMKFDTNKKLSIVLHAYGFTNDQGEACFMVSKSGIIDPIRTVRTAISNNTSTAVFDGIPEGYYLIFVYHDENNNGILDISPGNPWPVEGSAVAGQINTTHEPPVYGKYAVLVKGNRTNFRMEMIYDYK